MDAFVALRRHLEAQFPLGVYSLHGPSHWGRVAEFGERVGQESGADLVVVRLFALFHDSRRENEGDDPGHGARGAALARELRGRLFELDDLRLGLLEKACVHHTDGTVTDEPTLGTCWDADRLDLGRVGVRTSPRYLSTDAAKRLDILRWAMEKSARASYW